MALMFEWATQTNSPIPNERKTLKSTYQSCCPSRYFPLSGTKAAAVVLSVLDRSLD